MQKQIKFFFAFIIVILLSIDVALANNSVYINISNHIAKKKQMEVLSNNVANSNTIGFQQDNIINAEYIHKSKKNKADSFVAPEKVYRDKTDAGLIVTNRNLDIAVVGYGYFKVIDKLGPKYTMHGQLFINNNGVLVNSNGLPISGVDNQAIILPPDINTTLIQISPDGTIIVDKEIFAQIGVFGFADDDSLTKIGANLFASKMPDYLLEEFTIVNRNLRKSNVNTTKSMIEIMDAEKSLQTSTTMISLISNLEQNTINKNTKLNH